MDTTGIRFIDELELEEKRVLIRCDFNVPQDDEGNITDDARIQAALPTIRKAINENARVVLCSHLGRPKGKGFEQKYSMQPVAGRLSELLKREVIVPHDIDDPHTVNLIENLNTNRQLVLLENLRFHPGEKKYDPEFARYLASLADFYVNDAFGTAHRPDTSVYGVVQHFKRDAKAGGYLIKRELENLGGLFDQGVLPDHRVLLYYGFPEVDTMGILGEYSPEELLPILEQQGCAWRREPSPSGDHARISIFLREDAGHKAAA